MTYQYTQPNTNEAIEWLLDHYKVPFRATATTDKEARALIVKEFGEPVAKEMGDLGYWGYLEDEP